MSNEPIFADSAELAASWQQAAVFGLAIIGGILLRRLWGTTRGRDKSVYDVHAAWLRAGVYFIGCFILSSLTGVLQHITTIGWVSAENLSDWRWLLYTAICLVVILVGYWVIWPMGTLTHGRERHLPTHIFFGLLWGVSEAQLFLSVWAIAERFVSSRLIVVIIAFIVISAFTGIWHALYWDIYVAPEHNIEAWNARKVLFVHVPNLLLTLPYIAIFGSVGMFIVFQTLALVGSAIFMRFPRRSRVLLS